MTSTNEKRIPLNITTEICVGTVDFLSTAKVGRITARSKDATMTNCQPNKIQRMDILPSNAHDQSYTSNLSCVNVVMETLPCTKCLEIIQWEKHACVRQTANDIERAIKMKLINYVSQSFKDGLVDEDGELDMESVDKTTIANFNKHLQAIGQFDEALKSIDMTPTKFKCLRVGLKDLKDLFNGIAHSALDEQGAIYFAKKW